MTTARRYIPGREPRKSTRFATKLEGYQRARGCWVCVNCLTTYYADEGPAGRKVAAGKPICDRVVGRHVVGCGSKEFQRCDSKKEGERLVELARMLRRGSIEDLRCQVPFALHAVDSAGSRHRVATYRADFVYTRAGERVVEDVKPRSALPGPTTDSKQRAKAVSDLFALKRAIFEIEHGTPITLI